MRSNSLIPLLLAIFLHELGHIAIARICSIQLAELRLDIFGAALSPSSTTYSYRSEILLCLGGPLANIATATLLYTLPQTPFLSTLTASSIGLALINLLPIQGFDGGRILSATLSHFLTLKTVLLLCSAVSFIFIFMLWTFSVYLLLRCGASLSAFIFSLSLFSKIFLGSKALSS
jgi:stage IV sporulation protein FB